VWAERLAVIFVAKRIATKRACASSSDIRIISRSDNVRAAGLSKKCCGIGSSPLSGIDLSAAVEIERQLDYIPADDRDAGSSPEVVIEGPVVAPTMTGSALESADQRGRLSQLCARGAALLLILAPHPGRHSAGALTL
jgi:hypothetical protein